jgi:hypothetical protein
MVSTVAALGLAGVLGMLGLALMAAAFYVLTRQTPPGAPPGAQPSAPTG